ncbi:MAG: sulfite exporter TauE/SafE family protein [Solirubrobacteraceae bacterium]
MTVLAAVAVFLGASLQSATGFGFALVAAPIMFAAFGPQAAVTAGVLLGVEIGLLTLATEGRVPRVLRGDALALVAWSLPGIALGAIALRELPERLLSLLVAAGVLGGLALRLRARGAGPVRGRPRARRWSAPLAGVSSGALSTSTSLSGPPVVLHLLARGASPEQMRDTLAAVFVVLALLSVPALLIAGAFDVPEAVGALCAAGLAGQLLGRRLFARLAGERYEDVVLVVLAAAALVALATSAV